MNRFDCRAYVLKPKTYVVVQLLSHVQLFLQPHELYSLPGSSSILAWAVQGISQARILEWFAISFSRGSSQPRDRIHISGIGRQII